MLVGVADLGNGLELTSIYALEQYGDQHQINALGFFLWYVLSVLKAC